MKEIKITANESGQRLDKLLKKYLKEATGSFIYKMLRKKNIVLNDKKASGNEKLKEGDSVKLYFSDETLKKFEGQPITLAKTKKTSGEKIPVIYEDEHILLFNKPAGVLSQKAEKNDISIVEYLTDYLMVSGQITEETLKTFRPAVCNRLDRNTSGLIVAGKSLPGLQKMAEIFKDRSVKKYYLCIVKGKLTKQAHINGYLTKDEKTNKVTVKKTGGLQGDQRIETEYEPIAWNKEVTLLKVHLITGKTHQIRAHLSAIGHPLLGDYKYGNRQTNELYKKEYHLSAQLLHAYQITFPKMQEPLQQLTGKSYIAPVPEKFWKIIKETKWEHGIQEALEVQH